MKTIDKLAEQFKREGHGDEAWALENVDRLMREYAYTKDPLTKDAEQLGVDLRNLVDEWKAVTELTPLGEDTIGKLIDEAQQRFPVGSTILREEIIAWLDSRKTHWQPAAPVAPAVEGKRNSCDGCEYDNGPHLTPCNSCCDGEIRLNYKPIKPCPSCEKLRAENARLNGIIEEVLKALDEVDSALNQPKGE